MTAACSLALSLLYVGCSGEARYENLEANSEWIEESHPILFFDTLESGETGLFTIQLNGRSERKLLATTDEYVLSADGTKIAFMSFVGDTPACGIVDLRTIEEWAVPGPCEDVDWHPHGHVLAYTYESTKDDGSLALFDLATKSSQLVANIRGPIVGPRWSRDGTQLFFWGLFTETMYAASPATMRVNELGPTDNPGEFVRKEIGLSNLHFNQYTAALYGWSKARSPKAFGDAIVREGSLFLVGPEGEERLLVENTGDYNHDFGPHGLCCPEWTGDGSYILGHLSKPKRIVVVDVETGRAGIVTQGHHPLAHRPGYHPGDEATVHPFYYSSNRMQGL